MTLLVAAGFVLSACATAAPEPTPFRPAVQLFAPELPTALPSATPLPSTVSSAPTPMQNAAPTAASAEVPLTQATAPVALPSPVAMVVVGAGTGPGTGSGTGSEGEIVPTPSPELLTALPTATSASLTSASAQPEARPKAGLEWVNVRRAPGLNADIVAKMLAGGFARVVGRNTAGDWFAVQYDERAADTVGYVSIDVADVVGDVSQLPVMEPVIEPTLTPIPLEAPPADSQKAVVDAGSGDVASAAAAPAPAYTSMAGCPVSSGNSYELVPREGGPADRPDRQHGDLNLALRGFSPAGETAALVDYNGPTDGQAPQFSGLFVPGRFGTPTSTYRVNIWRFESSSCGGEPHGCRGPVDDKWPVTLLGLASTVGELIAMPSRDPIIYPNAQALVLFADETRITLGYTRQDTIAYGYAVYIENVCVDPNLLALYRAQIGGDGYRATNQLPGLRNGQVLGTAMSGEIIVGIRDTASWLDPRSRKDWWQR